MAADARRNIHVFGVALLAIGLIGPASAQPVALVEAATEAALGDVDFAAGAAGQLRVRRCTSCAYQTLSLTAGTRYRFAATALPRAEFLARVTELRSQPAARERASLTIFHLAGSSDVTRIALHPGRN